MYIPSAFRVADRDTLYDFIEQHGFATLVTAPEGFPMASHVPLWLDRERDVVAGHLARANPQADQLTSGESLAIFQGPHAYISPAWYATAPAVPTWNYTAVHVTGIARRLSSERTAELVDHLVSKYEASRSNPWPNELPEEYRERMLAGIVGFELPLQRIEGKFKLSQNRSSADQAGVAQGLAREGGAGAALAEFLAQLANRPAQA
ncbi:MAG: FMN-binding negative transcriptional regulator [Planctomycetaceae bacterium]